MTQTNAVVLAILGVGAVAVLAYLLRQAAGRRRRLEDIPPAMRPAYSDDQLERSVLERYMAWGLALTLFFAIFLPVYWLREPARINSVQDTRFVRSYVAGEQLYADFCANCHGTNAAGGAAQSPYDPEDIWPAPALNNVAARYADSSTVSDIREFLVSTVRRGRPGTPMPTWGAGFGGPMTDKQIDDIVDWLLANQVAETTEATAAANLSGADLYAQSCARCHGEDINGVVGPSLVGLFERHDETTILGILRNGIRLGTGALMPPWQEAYMYEGERYTDPALEKIVDYLREQQPATLPPGAEGYQTPGLGPTQDREPAAQPTDV